eukprot:UN4850
MQGSFWVQSLGCITMFTCSALYHHWSWDWRCANWLLSMDHVGISMMIMGCYAPYMLLFGYVRTLVFVWVLGSFGIAMEGFKLKRTDLHLSGGGSGEWKVFDIVHVLLYVVMGWSCLPMVPVVAPYLSSLACCGVVGGGVLYTVGIPALASGKLEFHMAVWHSFVLAGSACFYFVSLLQLSGMPGLSL